MAPSSKPGIIARLFGWLFSPSARWSVFVLLLAGLVLGAVGVIGTQVAVAVTGIAGPDGGQPDKPVGTVWFAWKFPKKLIISEVCHFSGDRAAVRQQTVAHALKQLLHNLA